MLGVFMLGVFMLGVFMLGVCWSWLKYFEGAFLLFLNKLPYHH